LQSVRVGTRGSDLAMWQARHVVNALRKLQPHLDVAVEVISTSGDSGAHDPFFGAESSGFFTKEIEDALLDKRIDLAVHSLKDLPTRLADGLIIAAVLEREDPADVLVSKSGLPLGALPRGAKVLTGAPRRQAQVLHKRGDLVCLPVRGNVPTRLRKLEESDAEALILARAGLVRLGLSDRVTERLDPLDFLPSCGQGALAVEARSDDERAAQLCGPLEHFETRVATEAERSFLNALESGCRAAAGAYARVTAQGVLSCAGMAASPDGTAYFRDEVTDGATSFAAAEALGRRLAERLLSQGAGRALGGRASPDSAARRGEP